MTDSLKEKFNSFLREFKDHKNADRGFWVWVIGLPFFGEDEIIENHNYLDNYEKGLLVNSKITEKVIRAFPEDLYFERLTSCKFSHDFYRDFSDRINWGGFRNGKYEGLSSHVDIEADIEFIREFRGFLDFYAIMGKRGAKVSLNFLKEFKENLKKDFTEKELELFFKRVTWTKEALAFFGSKKVVKFFHSVFKDGFLIPMNFWYHYINNVVLSEEAFLYFLDNIYREELTDEVASFLALIRSKYDLVDYSRDYEIDSLQFLTHSRQPFTDKVLEKYKGVFIDNENLFLDLIYRTKISQKKVFEILEEKGYFKIDKHLNSCLYGFITRYKFTTSQLDYLMTYEKDDKVLTSIIKNKKQLPEAFIDKHIIKITDICMKDTNSGFFQTQEISFSSFKKICETFTKIPTRIFYEMFYYHHYKDMSDFEEKLLYLMNVIDRDEFLNLMRHNSRIDYDLKKKLVAMVELM